MDTKQALLKALRDEANADDVVMRLYDLFKVEKGITAAEVVTPCEAHRRMGKWLKESYYFERFREHYKLPTGRIEYRDKPDVILHGAKKIGIEITNFYLEDGGCTDSEQRQSEVRDKVVSEAQRIYLANGGKRIELSFSFNKASPIRDRGKLARKIAGLGKHIDGRKSGRISKDTFNDIPELLFVYINAEEYQDPEWRVVQVYDGPILSRDKLLEIVRKKESKVPDYRHCDAYWLVVVVDFIDPAQDQEIQTL